MVVTENMSSSFLAAMEVKERERGGGKILARCGKYSVLTEGRVICTTSRCLRYICFAWCRGG